MFGAKDTSGKTPFVPSVDLGSVVLGKGKIALVEIPLPTSVVDVYVPVGKVALC